MAAIEDLRERFANWAFPWWRGRSPINKMWLLFSPFLDIMGHLAIGMAQVVFFLPKPEHNYMRYFRHNLEFSLVFQIKCGIAAALFAFGVWVALDEYKWRRKTHTREHDVPPGVPIVGWGLGTALFLVFGPIEWSPLIVSGANLLWLAIS